MSKLNGIALIACLTISTAVLGGCATEQRVVVKTVCPQLDSPTMRVIEGFEAVGTIDPPSAEWVVKLDEHYQKLDKCKPRRKK